MNIIFKSKKHCEETSESYFQHLNVAIKISFDLLKASLMAFVHSLIPALFEKGASKKIIDIYNFLQEKNRTNDEN